MQQLYSVELDSWDLIYFTPEYGHGVEDTLQTSAFSRESKVLQGFSCQ